MNKKIILIILTIIFFTFFPSSKTKNLKKNQPQPSPTLKPTIKKSPTTTPLPNTTQTPPLTQKSNLYQVVKVIDGDTIVVKIDGKDEVIRLIGINTPETVDPRRPVECFGREASDKAKEILTGKKVFLEADPTQADRDKYGRLLRYVFLEDGTNFNKLMIMEGFAFEYTYYIPYKYQSEFKEAERKAREAKKGLWADDACILATPTSQTNSTTFNQVKTNQCQYPCDGPDRDCSDFQTQKQAQEFFNCCGFSPTYDPMNLDSVGVGDGIVCEKLP